MTDTSTAHASGRSIVISRPGKVLFPADGLTKADLANHYLRAADVMLPHVRARPVSMKRYPNGIDGHAFYHKRIPDYFPDWVDRVKVRSSKGIHEHAVIGDAATLVYLADQACIEPHVWLARADDLLHPDQLVFDLDPSTDDLGMVRDCARVVREVLEAVGLVPFVKTSGSRGYHVTVPLDRSATFEATRAFSESVAAVVAHADPDRFTTEFRKANRRGRVFVDVMRNGYAQTTIPPYGVRALPGAPVATPIEWDELGRVEPRAFSVRTLPRRLERHGDPWAGMRRRARAIRGPRERLSKIASGGRAARRR